MSCADAARIWPGFGAALRRRPLESTGDEGSLLGGGIGKGLLSTDGPEVTSDESRFWDAMPASAVTRDVGRVLLEQRAVSWISRILCMFVMLYCETQVLTGERGTVRGQRRIAS